MRRDVLVEAVLLAVELRLVSLFFMDMGGTPNAGESRTTVRSAAVAGGAVALALPRTLDIGGAASAAVSRLAAMRIAGRFWNDGGDRPVGFR